MILLYVIILKLVYRNSYLFYMGLVAVFVGITVKVYVVGFNVGFG